MKKKINIVWFKRDLRLSDHVPLMKALSHELDFIPLYIFEPIVEFNYDFDYRHWQFVYESLQKMNANLPLSFFYGPVEAIFESILQKFEIQNVFSHQETGVEVTFDRDKRMKKFFKSKEVSWTEFQSNGVVRGLRSREHWDALWVKWMTSPIENIQLDLKKVIVLDEKSFQLPQNLREKISFNTFDPAGFEEARRRVDEFLTEKVEDYWGSLSYPEKSRYHTSRLSPYISWGNISIREIYQSSLKARGRIKNKKSLDQFMARLKWHCHFVQKLEMEVSLEFKNLNPAFDHLRTKEDKDLFKAWKNGQTGYPLIDAAMRCVRATGHLNFRLRATVVSFLTHLLWQPWQPGARYLARMFVDYEPGIHFPQFQMQAGTTGVNSIRIYNPIKQSVEKDKEGTFIKKWVPELRDLPVEFLHRPWLMTEMDELLFSFKLGKNYPKPIVDFEKSYKRSQELLWRTKQSESNKKHSQKILQKHSRKNKFRT
jgi:deoxyribodipyrimidine photo-lyase